MPPSPPARLLGAYASFARAVYARLASRSGRGGETEIGVLAATVMLLIIIGMGVVLIYFIAVAPAGPVTSSVRT